MFREFGSCLCAAVFLMMNMTACDVASELFAPSAL